MNKEVLLNRLINKTRYGELKWVRRIVKGGKVFYCKQKIDNKKKLLLRVFFGDNMERSFFDVRMTNNVFIERIELSESSNLYNLIFILDFKI